ncbi:transaldolase [Candidatus Uhrbacteria bacterium]|nr:transaldolase [Candidatus Uhrbacteria bacterium]
MKPENLRSKIFLDGGDARETKTYLDSLGFLDGQTTNPSLIAKNPEARKRIERGEKFSADELLGFYKDIVQEISVLIPHGSVSVEVYADRETTAEDMLAEGRKMYSWIPNAHIKLPTTAEGLKAAHQAIAENMRINMTLVFSQEQAAAVYAATRGATKGQVFLSPFVGRLDDRGENGMSLIKNILEMYKKGDGHVEVLTASVRSLDHFLYALALQSDIITTPAKILHEWHEAGMPLAGDEFNYDSKELKPLPYQELDLARDWTEFDIQHELTDVGVEKFAADWNALIQ